MPQLSRVKSRLTLAPKNPKLVSKMDEIHGMLIDFCAKMEIVNPLGPKYPDTTKWLRLITEEFEEVVEAHSRRDLVGVAHELADLAYVVEAAFQAFGLDSRPIMAEVHRANMLKSASCKREDGKVLKPINYRKPEVLRMVLDQIK